MSKVFFYDDHAIAIEDRDHAEERFVTLGMDGFGRLLVVAYHYRSEDEIRVISPLALLNLTSDALIKRTKS